MEKDKLLQERGVAPPVLTFYICPRAGEDDYFQSNKTRNRKSGLQIFTALCNAVIDQRPLCDFIDGLQ